MLCQKCHKNLATARYAEVVDGKVTDVHLCAACLRKLQEEAGTGFELSGPTPTARFPARPPRPRRRSKVRRTCRSCGTELARVQDSAQVGCITCYDVFARDIEAMLTTLHGAVRHRGKAPHVDDARTRLRADLQDKRALLRMALETEDYEDAAALRDGIRRMELDLSTLESRQD